MRFDYKEWAKVSRHKAWPESCRMFREAVQQRAVEIENFSVRACAYETLGRRLVESWDPRSPGGITLAEAGDAVDPTAFSNITGQIVYSTFLQAYEDEEFTCTRLISTTPTRLDGEKIPGIGKIGDQAEIVEPGMPFEHVGVGEDYIQTPSTDKRGFIVSVTKEAIFFDRTNLLLKRASDVGQQMGINKEKRAADLICGTTNNHSWKGDDYDTYAESTGAGNGEAGGTGLVVNKVTSNELVDWTDVDAANQLFNDILDPNTDEPVVIKAKDVLVCPAYEMAAERVLNATQVRYTGSGAASETVYVGTLTPRYTVHSSRQLYRRIVASGEAAGDAKKWWFLGDFGKAFTYMQNWPITLSQAPQNNDAEFNQDIVAQYKASERGVFAVINPRFVVKCTG